MHGQNDHTGEIIAHGHYAPPTDYPHLTSPWSGGGIGGTHIPSQETLRGFTQLSTSESVLSFLIPGRRWLAPQVFEVGSGRAPFVLRSSWNSRFGLIHLGQIDSRDASRWLHTES